MPADPRDEARRQARLDLATALVCAGMQAANALGDEPPRTYTDAEVKQWLLGLSRHYARQPRGQLPADVQTLVAAQQAL